MAMGASAFRPAAHRPSMPGRSPARVGAAHRASPRHATNDPDDRETDESGNETEPKARGIVALATFAAVTRGSRLVAFARTRSRSARLGGFPQRAFHRPVAASQRPGRHVVRLEAGECSARGIAIALIDRRLRRSNPLFGVRPRVATRRPGPYGRLVRSRHPARSRKRRHQLRLQARRARRT
jgi:hypothetical protein